MKIFHAALVELTGHGKPKVKWHFSCKASTADSARLWLSVKFKHPENMICIWEPKVH